ncbi:cellulose biosynthesis cyclic di-GMP-binding regulatory protein BcsB [Loigolactobacillus jiayinensis]|uniref:Cellulose biosynthesis cyclic di-GMP-binding regulatory protein BcsB n=1 Tax=Loigolactobacillus jiayinensis TaxID=2486016 RepID=A0ABW1RI89_9LACO
MEWWGIFVNKSFISKRAGIKHSAINNLIIVIGLLIGLFGVSLTVHAADLKSYTQPFQNQTTSLTGTAVSANMYFIKVGYWDVKQATLNLNYQVSQLSNQTTSDITVSINGTKFYSFRPQNKTGLQTETIDIPTDLIGGTNNLRITGQILDQDGKKNYDLAQTPANWLTIYSGANVNFQYLLKPPTTAIKSFYNHFSGPDTIANAQTSISVPEQADNAELTAAVYALAGYSRTMTNEEDQVPINTFSSKRAQSSDYQMIIATYDHLPSRYRKLVSRSELNKRAVLKTDYVGDKHVLLLTATSGALLEKASRFVANQELMKETASDTEYIDAQTQTFTSSLQYDGSYQLTNTGEQITGPQHQEATYFVSLPVDRTNADGSQIRLHYKYASNLDFSRSLATVYVNNKPIGSQKLRASKANDDSMTVTLPKGKTLGNTFVIRVAFDLEMKNSEAATNNQTPWAYIESDSKAYIKSQPVSTQLFSNYPSLFLKNQTFNNIAVVKPAQLTSHDFKTLTNIFNLLGNFAESNTGNVQFYDQMPSEKVLRNQNVIAFGTPKQNQLIRQLNSKLYFKFNQNFTRFKSNEKLSIERAYGRRLGVAQLLRSPYNDKRVILAVTAAHSTDVELASTQINFQKNISQYSGDAIVVDHDNNHYSYRFKRKKDVAQHHSVAQTVKQHSQLVIYLGLTLFALVLIALILFLLLRKNGLLKQGGEQNEK